jgi:alkyl sulfatase BDS1-like metallo-beta-lactamase superfamily hydrolase
VWRQYGGWWDRNPATLKPAPERALAAELASLAGGPGALAERALQLLAAATDAPEDGAGAADEALRVAGHLAESAWLADPADPAIGRARQAVFTARAQRATSTMARGVFTWAANESVATPEAGHGDAGTPHPH